MRFIILLISISFIVSCTVQKRMHRKGWHVEWKKNYRTPHDDRTNSQEEATLPKVLSPSNKELNPKELVVIQVEGSEDQLLENDNSNDSPETRMDASNKNIQSLDESAAEETSFSQDGSNESGPIKRNYAPAIILLVLLLLTILGIGACIFNFTISSSVITGFGYLLIGTILALLGFIFLGFMLFFFFSPPQKSQFEPPKKEDEVTASPVVSKEKAKRNGFIALSFLVAAIVFVVFLITT